MLDRTELADAVLAECGGDNLVLIQEEKYVLNWDKDIIVNISPGPINPKHRIQLGTLLDKIN